MILAFDKKNGFIGFSALAVYPLMMLVILNVVYRKYFVGKRHPEQSPPPLPRADGGHSEGDG